MSIIVLGLIFNTSFSELVFADKPDKEQKEIERADAKTQREIESADAKTQREIESADAKTQREIERADAKEYREEIKGFENGIVVGTSSTTIICHFPPGNTDNYQEITIGTPALNAHLAHGDNLESCEGINGEAGESNSNEQEIKNTVNESLIDQLTTQIADLQKRLQELFGI